MLLIGYIPPQVFQTAISQIYNGSLTVFKSKKKVNKLQLPAFSIFNFLLIPRRAGKENHLLHFTTVVVQTIERSTVPIIFVDSARRSFCQDTEFLFRKVFFLFNFFISSVDAVKMNDTDIFILLTRFYVCDLESLRYTKLKKREPYLYCYFFGISILFIFRILKAIWSKKIKSVDIFLYFPRLSSQKWDLNVSIFVQ